jgi:hypothetical protein
MSYNPTVLPSLRSFNLHAWYWTPKIKDYLKNPGLFARIVEWAGQHLERCHGKPLNQRVVTRLDPELRIFSLREVRGDGWASTALRTVRFALCYLVKPLALLIHRLGPLLCPLLCPLHIFRRSDGQIYIGRIYLNLSSQPRIDCEGEISSLLEFEGIIHLPPNQAPNQKFYGHASISYCYNTRSDFFIERCQERYINGVYDDGESLTLYKPKLLFYKPENVPPVLDVAEIQDMNNKPIYVIVQAFSTIPKQAPTFYKLREDLSWDHFLSFAWSQPNLYAPQAIAECQQKLQAQTS